jgi:hypothetical protein
VASVEGSSAGPDASADGETDPFTVLDGVLAGVG